MKISIPYFWSKLFLRLHGKSIRSSVIDKTSRVNSGSNIVNTTMGRYSYCGYNCWIIASDIGAFCSVSNEVRIGGPSHPIDWVSTSPVFHEGKNMFGKHFAEHPFDPYKRTKIGNDVWIGENAMIKAGVKIGDGAVIGMGAVVTKDVGAYEIWAGNPAKMIKKRFDEETVSKLSAMQWWNFSDERLVHEASLFSDVKSYLSDRGNNE